MGRIYINTDGGSRGNPGPAAIGVAFFDSNGTEIYHHRECIGKATNNEAEYRAIIKALEILVRSKWFTENNTLGKEVVCRLDSLLVVEQINGNYKVKQDHLKQFILAIESLKAQIALDIKFVHIPREENKIADKLVNMALDDECKK